MKKEVWKDIRPYYQISTYGNVKSLERSTNFGDVIKNIKEKILTPRKHTKQENSYLRVQINKKEEYIHILVAQAFIPNPENKPSVNHINGIKSDNRVENLEWATYKEQMDHAWRNSLMTTNGCIGIKNGRCILTEFQVLEIRSKYIPCIYTIQMLSDEYNVSYSTIQSILLRKTWKHI